MLKQEHGTIWVCVDCYVTHANGVSESLDPDAPEPLSRIEDYETVTIGMIADEHEPECPAFEDGEFTGNECFGCEQREFSWQICDGCGSHLGGSRHALTVWWNDDETGA